MTKKIRITLIVLYFVLGALFLLAGIKNGFLFFIAGIIAAWGHVKYGSVSAAWRALKKSNFPKAKKLLEETKNPDILAKSVKGYYYMILGYVSMSEEKYYESVENYHKALEIGLRTKNDEAIVHFQLSLIYMAINKIDLVKHHLEQAKDLNPKKLLIEKIQSAQNLVKNNDLTDKNMLEEFLKTEGEYYSCGVF